MEEEEKIRLILEDLSIEPEKINQFLEVYRNKKGEEELINAADKEFDLWKLLNKEDNDWRKKTILAAKIISLQLEE